MTTRSTLTSNKFWIADVLHGLKKGKKTTSNYLLDQLVKQGYVESYFIENPHGRGRPAKAYTLAKNGERLLEMAKKWQKPRGLIS